MQVNKFHFPLDRKYHKSHLWLKPEENVVTLGIDAFLANKVGYINFLTIEKKSVKAGEAFASIESGKYVSRIYSPINGDILERNEEVISNPRRINENPYDAWIVTIQPDVKDGIDSANLLEKEKEINDWIQEEIKKFEEEEDEE